MYIFDNSTLYAVTFAPLYAQSTVLHLNVSESITFRSVAVYVNPFSLDMSISYITSDNMLYLLRDGVVTLVSGNEEGEMHQVVTDGEMLYVSSVEAYSSYVEHINITNVDQMLHQYIDVIPSTSLYFRSMAP